MNLAKLLIAGAFAVTLLYAIIALPLDSLTSFNPVEWLADSVKGFFDWFFGLFFGWMF